MWEVLPVIGMFVLWIGTAVVLGLGVFWSRGSLGSELGLK